MKSCFGRAVWSLVLTGFGAYCTWSLATETPRSPSALSSSLIRYNLPGGETLFALSLKAALLKAPAAHDHVILFDTSASQAGAHRRQGLAVLDACLASLKTSDRVQLVSTRVYPVADLVIPIITPRAGRGGMRMMGGMMGGMGMGMMNVTEPKRSLPMLPTTTELAGPPYRN